jgi:Tol biopolymer transport system component
VERTGAKTDIDVATLGNKGKVRGVHSIITLSGSLSHLTWAPDGRRLVFVRTTVGHSVIQSVGPSGGGLQPLADPALGARDPAFAPNDGRSIAYDASPGGPIQIWSMSQNGGNPRPLTHRAGDCSNPTWSPDGQLIAFVGRVGDVDQLFVMSRNGQRQRQLTRVRAGLSDPAWSRDAHRIYFVQNVSTGGSRLVAIDVKSRKLKFLTEPMAAISQPMVAPEGDIIFFVGQQAGVQQLFELRLGGDHPVAITDLAGGAYQPVLSPNGATIAFASRSTPGTSPSPSSTAPSPTSS